MRPRTWANSNSPAAKRSLREHFAGMAMQGLLSTDVTFHFTDPKIVVERAVDFADRLIQELERPFPSPEEP